MLINTSTDDSYDYSITNLTFITTIPNISSSWDHLHSRANILGALHIIVMCPGICELNRESKVNYATGYLLRCRS